MKVFQVTWHNTIGKRKDGTTHVIADSFTEVVYTFEGMFPKRSIRAIALVSTSVIEKSMVINRLNLPTNIDVDYAEEDE